MLLPERRNRISSNQEYADAVVVQIKQRLMRYRQMRDKVKKLSKVAQPSQATLNLIKDQIDVASRMLSETDRPLIGYDTIEEIYLNANDEQLNPPGDGTPVREIKSVELGLHTRRYKKVLQILKCYTMPELETLMVTSIDVNDQDLKEFYTHSIVHPLKNI